jgi:hypothetical protein
MAMNRLITHPRRRWRREASDVAVETTTAKPEGSEDRNPDGTFKAKPKKGSVNRLIWEREEAERKFKAAEDRAAKLEADLAAARTPKPVERPIERREPAPEAKPEKFTFDPYEAWLAKHEDGSYEDYMSKRGGPKSSTNASRKIREEREREQHESLGKSAAAHRVREIAARDHNLRITTRA